jgi:response regulator RpfG family c-di-GMP phosphodiesterase
MGDIRNIEDSDELIFAKESDDTCGHDILQGVWKVLIVDDEQEVHNVTLMVLADLVFKNKVIQFFHAYSGDETIRLIEEHPDTAVILLDVVMEDDDSGLKVIKHIRDIIRNPFVRIVIRTGQPGEAPEKKVIVDYDINDYREKTELTAQKLFSTVISSLRSYESLITIEMNRKGLEKIITASAKLLELQSASNFAVELLDQVMSFFAEENEQPKNKLSGFIVERQEKEMRVVAASGQFLKNRQDPFDVIASSETKAILVSRKKDKSGYYLTRKIYLGYFKSKNDFEIIVYIEASDRLTNDDKYLIEILTSIVSSIYENIQLSKEIENTQKEILFTLGEVIETRSHETGNHVRKVAEYSKLLALKYGLSEEEAELIKQASPMHDVGKVGILDRILNKPEKLTTEEFNEIKTHTSRGYNIFKASNRKLLKAAAIIAYQHHERWNGSGYPNGLSGEQIHIFGRITCLADIFDALGSDRVYKKAWELNDILEYIRAEKGKTFDPRLVDIFFENLDEIKKIRDSLEGEVY